MLTKMDLKGFLDELASDSPAPGGGSVAALAGALGASLNAMVCNLTIGKKGYENDEAMLKALRFRSTKIKDELVELIDKDTEAFNAVMAAYKMSKDDKKRGDAIQDALKGAAEVPFGVAKLCKEMLTLSRDVAAKGNKNSITDAGSAALMADAGLQIAALNVRINLSSIKDEKFTEEMDQKLSEIEAEAIDLVDEAMHVVLNEIDPELEEEGIEE